MLNEFKAFIMKGNVLDLAVAVIIGAAFATITTSLTEDVIMPIVSAIFGVPDFSGMFILLGSPLCRCYDRLCRAEGSGCSDARLGPVPDRRD